MRILIFWDSITEWYFDMLMWWWANMLKVELMTLDYYYEVANLWISWDDVNDILKRIEFTVNTYTNKYNDDLCIIFQVWINDTAIMWLSNELYTINDFEDNLKKLINVSKKLTDNVFFMWITKVNQDLVSPLLNSKRGISYNNSRIKLFNNVIKNNVLSNWFKYIEMFDLLDYTDLFDWLHPNTTGHTKIYNKVKYELNL